jgi:sugar (pentulose or hexulose) kinase
VTLTEQEAAAYGAALQSIWTYERERGGSVSIADVVRERVKTEKATIEPDRNQAALYDSLQERFNSLWRTLTEEFRAHRKAEN